LKKKREQGYPYIDHHILCQQSKTYFIHPSIIICSLLSSINNSLHSSICFSNQPCSHLSTTRCIHLSASAANLALIHQQLVAFIYLHQQPTLLSSNYNSLHSSIWISNQPVFQSLNKKLGKIRIKEIHP
jgi:hypothetical protein